MIAISTVVVIVLSGLLFIATEFFFPINANDPLAAKQKHFWSIMLTIFSSVLGFTIKTAYETQDVLSARIQNVGSIFEEMSSEDIRDEFQRIFSLYHRHFDHAQPVLRSWALRALVELRHDMNDGFIPLPREVAADEIGRVYPSARESIVATNVGGTGFYFGNQTYVQSNVGARDRGVPIIRFYLWSENQRIQLRSSKEPERAKLDDFVSEVRELHLMLGSLCSIVLDVDKARLLEIRDLLILDNTFVAETMLSPSWEPIRARATHDQRNLRRARDYFRSLFSAVDRQRRICMSDQDVKMYFHKYERVKAGGGQLALEVFQEVMRGIMGPT